MTIRKTIFILASLIFIIISIFFSYFFFFRPRLEQKRLVNPQCPQEFNIVMADPEEFTYTSDNIKKVVGYINLDPKLIKGIQYDLFGFKGAVGLSTSFWSEELWDIPKDDWVKHTGWKKIDLDTKKTPVTFNIEPQFPDTINKHNFLGVYMKAVCKDGSMSHSTKIDLVRDPYPKLHWVTSSSPRKIKYLK